MSYAQVDGLNMYYEIHGTGRPLVLLHGGLSAIGTSFDQVLPHLAKNYQVIAVELQAHGRTADVPDRPLSYERLADDTAGLLEQLGVGNADFFGYSVGGGVALQLAITRPHLVGKLVLAGMSTTLDGLHPGLMEGMSQLTPEHLAGSPFAEEYARIAPNPGDWPTLIEKIKQLDLDFQGWSDEAVRAVEAPAFVVIGDSDIIRPEHAVEMFRLFGGGVMGDSVGLPKSRLAILPGTTHITLVNRADWLASMIDDFLDA